MTITAKVALLTFLFFTTTLVDTQISTTQLVLGLDSESEQPSAELTAAWISTTNCQSVKTLTLADELCLLNSDTSVPTEMPSMASLWLAESDSKLIRISGPKSYLA